MGNAESSSTSILSTNDLFWNPPSQSNNAEHLKEFRKELARKQEVRRTLIAEKRREFEQLREQLQKVCEENTKLKQSTRMETPNQENDALKAQVEQLQLQVGQLQEVQGINRELRISVSEMQMEVQRLNSEQLNVEEERLEYTKHVTALKDVVKVTKNMLAIRESQIQGLKEKVESVEQLLASKEMKIMADGLREEYEKQLRNIRNLRTLYEERQRVDKIDKEHLQVQLSDARKEIENAQQISSDRLTRIEELEKDASMKYDEVTQLRSSLGLAEAECKELQSEIAVINQLFSQILLGFNNSSELDLDKLIKTLEENHDLLTDIASNEESHSTAAALPKVLLNLINQINKESHSDEWTMNSSEMCNEQLSQLNSPAAIVENLPKVWKVLIELLSHQHPPLSALNGGEKYPCYNSVDTPTGPKQKLSVSKTFIRLKDLIMEKKFLEREMYRLKHLNIHLEGRLQDQEKRLELVSGELKTTWHVVDKMQRQHKQLHTHEKILRYELHEKRKLLTELKEELEYCRDKWVQARAKNDCTQEQWKQLRIEFAARKTQVDDFNQSAESGFSDDKDSSEDDEKGYESDESECHKRDADEASANLNASGTIKKTLENIEMVQANEKEQECEKTEMSSNTKELNEPQEEIAGPSKTHNTGTTRSAEDLIAAREERLRRLEEASNRLFEQVCRTKIKSANISNKLDNLHEMYGDAHQAEVVAESEASSSESNKENEQDQID